VCWQNYCMPSCDPNVALSNEGQRCLAAPDATAGVLLDRCDPLGNDCPSTLNCLRTNILLANDGLCVPTAVCSTNADCPGNVKTTCGGEVLRQLLGASSHDYFTDHLVCVKDNCIKDGCAPDQRCLPAHFARYAYMPELCLDNCDSSAQCPPGFACAPGEPGICLPGVPGVPCTRREDCLIGSCVDTGADFKICSIGCGDDADCSFLDQGIYHRCIAGPSGPEKHCINPTPFEGWVCTSDDMCTGVASVCFPEDPRERVSTRSFCRVPCDENGLCAVRGGLAHTCLGPEGGCFPGDFGIPCNASSECMEPLTCEEITLEAGRDIVKENDSDASSSSLRICTVLCHDELDSICDAVPATLGNGYCASDDRCHASAPPGSPCERDQHCVSGNCEGNMCTAQVAPLGRP